MMIRGVQSWIESNVWILQSRNTQTLSILEKSNKQQMQFIDFFFHQNIKVGLCSEVLTSTSLSLNFRYNKIFLKVLEIERTF